MWKLNLREAFFPSSFFTTLFKIHIWKGTCWPFMGSKMELFLWSIYIILFMFVALYSGAINCFLLLKFSSKILITSLLKFFKFFFLENPLMLISFFLVLKLLVCLFLNLSSLSFYNIGISFGPTIFFSLTLVL